MCMKLIDYANVEETKTVYVLRFIDLDGNICSPFRYLTKWELGVQQTVNTEHGIHEYSIGDHVEGSFFHSFPTLELAEYFLKIYKEKNMLYKDEIQCIFEAEISKCDIGIGEISQHCIGAGLLCIVSPNLTLIEKVKDGKIC